MRNKLAGDLSLAEGKNQYDNHVKRVLANKIILAWILKQTLICQIEKKLAKGMAVPEIADALEETEETIRRLIDGMR